MLTHVIVYADISLLFMASIFRGVDPSNTRVRVRISHKKETIALFEPQSNP